MVAAYRTKNYWRPTRRMMGSRSEREQTSGTNRKGDIIRRPGEPRPGAIFPPVAPTGTTFTPSTYVPSGPSNAPSTQPMTPSSVTSSIYPSTVYNQSAVPSVPGAPGSDISDPLGGFGKPFLPGAVPMLYDNPELLGLQAMANMGYGDLAANQGLYQMIRPQMEYANWLAGLALGQGSDLGAGGNEAALNWIGNFAQNLMTPGGEMVNFNQGLNALGAGIGNPNSAIGQFLNVDDPAAQVANFKSLALPLAAAGLHPFFARAFQNAVNQAGDQYMLGAATNAGIGNFGNFFGQQTPYI